MALRVLSIRRIKNFDNFVFIVVHLPFYKLCSYFVALPLCLQKINFLHFVLASLDQNLWRRILTSFDVDIPEFLQRNKEVLTSMVLEAEVFSTVRIIHSVI